MMIRLLGDLKGRAEEGGLIVTVSHLGKMLRDGDGDGMGWVWGEGDGKMERWEIIESARALHLETGDD